MRTFIRRYGAHPRHLLLLIGCFVVAGYAALKMIDSRPVAVLVWFVGAAVVHDFVLLPLCGLVDRGMRSIRRRTDEHPRANAVNYLRFPAVISGILLLVYLPSIARLSSEYTSLTALSASGYLLRWLAVTGVLFLLSGIAFTIRTIRSR